jgi:hypothetical protein
MRTSSDPGKPVSNITYVQTLLSARHASVAHTGLYVQDSFTLFDLVQEEQCQESQRVSPWKSVLIVQMPAAIGIVAHSCIKQQKFPSQNSTAAKLCYVVSGTGQFLQQYVNITSVIQAGGGFIVDPRSMHWISNS